MEALAVELATLAGREIVAAFGTIFMVRTHLSRVRLVWTSKFLLQ